LNNSLAAVLFVAILLMGLSAGWIGGNVNLSGSMVATQTTNSRLPVEVTGKVVNLDIIADWGGSTYDAFVVSSYTNGTVPKPATNGTGPGANDNNITVQAGTTVTFIITNLDTAVLVNFTGPVSTDFIVYNNTESGQVASHYSAGQSISSLPISHTFTIQDLNINIPIPPDTVVTFTYTFTTPGVYKFFCQTPCGPGMEIAGYMIGYLIVT
jgi:plastocyanin